MGFEILPTAQEIMGTDDLPTDALYHSAEPAVNETSVRDVFSMGGSPIAPGYAGASPKVGSGLGLATSPMGVGGPMTLDPGQLAGFIVCLALLGLGVGFALSDP